MLSGRQKQMLGKVQFLQGMRKYFCQSPAKEVLEQVRRSAGSGCASQNDEFFLMSSGMKDVSANGFNNSLVERKNKRTG